MVEGEFDVFGEAFSFGWADRVEMVGEEKALRILGCCDLGRRCSSTFTDVAAPSDHPGEVAFARGSFDMSAGSGEHLRSWRPPLQGSWVPDRRVRRPVVR